MQALAEMGLRMARAPLCKALARPRSTFYRSLQSQEPHARPPAKRASSNSEKEEISCVAETILPRASAEGPNQLWSWDIIKLMGPATWTYFCLYVILDVFSRSVVISWRSSKRSVSTLRARHCRPNSFGLAPKQTPEDSAVLCLLLAS